MPSTPENDAYVKRLLMRVGYRLVPKCRRCGRPLDRDRVCWYHTP